MISNQSFIFKCISFTHVCIKILQEGGEREGERGRDAILRHSSSSLFLLPLATLRTRLPSSPSAFAIPRGERPFLLLRLRVAQRPLNKNSSVRHSAVVQASWPTSYRSWSPSDPSLAGPARGLSVGVAAVGG